ncbi:MAG: hypothetical protein K2W99_04550 [Chthoniobacterales bacterium]|nr:hypothetical protein [Chthoniobacterales bacterium]
MKNFSTLLIVLLVSLSIFSVAFAQEAMTAAAPTASATAAPYPLTNCIVSGDKLGGPMGGPVVEHYQGEEVQFCCKDCVNDFQKDPQKYLKRLHEAAAKTQKVKSEG